MSINKEKLKWRSRRSMLELDLYFNRFIQDDGLNQLNDNELYAYRELLDLEDQDLVLLFQGIEKLDDKIAQVVVDKIRQVVKN